MFRFRFVFIREIRGYPLLICGYQRESAVVLFC
jgi:hypothetical protein